MPTEEKKTDPRTEEKKTDPRTVQLKGVTLSFAESLKDKKKASTAEDARLVHGANVLIMVGSPNYEANKAKCIAAMKAACAEEWKREDKYLEIEEDNPKRVCYRKGDKFKNQQTGEVYEGYAGNMVVVGKGPGGGQRRPKLLDRSKRRLRDQAKPEDVKIGRFFTEDDINDIFYNGTLCDVVVAFYGTKKGGDCVTCSFEAIRSQQEGERMGGAGEVDDDEFDDLEDTGAAADDDDIG